MIIPLLYTVYSIAIKNVTGSLKLKISHISWHDFVKKKKVNYCTNPRGYLLDSKLYACAFPPEDEEGVMVGQSQAVSTEALMNVFHPHDAENLDPKMVTLLQY